MKIFGICLVKNEEDIIAYALSRQSEWATKIFVYDNGSTDRTWEIVKEVALTNPKIVPFKTEAKPFRDGLRAEVFNAYSHLVSDGDWWCVRCDTDEIYIDDPREFLTKVPNKYHVVSSIHFEYRLTKDDVVNLSFDKPVEALIEQLKYYHKKQTSEVRFVRHRNRLQWPENKGYGFPKHRGILAPDKIRIKHFQYRSPEQIQRRIAIRKIATEQGYKFFKRDNVDNWEDKLVSKEECIFDNGFMQMGYLQNRNTVPILKLLLLRILHGTKIFP